MEVNRFLRVCFKIVFRGNISGNSSCVYASNNSFSQVSSWFTNTFNVRSTLIVSLRCHNEAPEVETVSEQGDVWAIGYRHAGESKGCRGSNSGETNIHAVDVSNGFYLPFLGCDIDSDFKMRSHPTLTLNVPLVPFI